VKVGLVLAGLLALSDVLGSLLVPVDRAQVAPPLGVFVLAGILGAVTLVFVVIAWLRRSRGAIRIVAGTRILSAVTALPAFFAGPPAPFVIWAAAGVTLTVIAVAMAGIAYVATRGGEPAEREVTTVAGDKTPSATPSPSYAPTKKPKPEPPAVQRGKVYVEVYNNSGITGLAGRYATTAGDVGWQVVGEDNWVGSVPESTVYYPARLEAAGKQLALDLGISRTMPAVGEMRLDRLTVILTADAA
jgi:hypothetical protein